MSERITLWRYRSYHDADAWKPLHAGTTIHENVETAEFVRAGELSEAEAERDRAEAKLEAIQKTVALYEARANFNASSDLLTSLSRIFSDSEEGK